MRTVIPVILGLSVVASAQHRTPRPALTATYEKATRPIGGSATTATGAFYRDSQGRTRLELDQQARIYDPSSGMSILLDLGQKVAYVSRGPTNQQEPQTRLASNSAALRPYRDAQSDLGSQLVGGVLATGERHTVRFPSGSIPGSGIRSVVMTTESWWSSDLALAVLVKTTDSRYGDVAAS